MDAKLFKKAGVSRRLFMAYAASLSSLPLIGQESASGEKVSFDSDPFTFGVASGDPDETSVILWTKLAPKPLETGGGMPQVPVSVSWQLAEDEGMKKLVNQGEAVASPRLGHSVHVEAAGLKSNRWYYYRFTCGDTESMVGRTRTLAAADEMSEKLRFAVTSCQNFEQGLFTAYEQMAQDAPDFVFHLGDYIYEYASGRNGKVRKHIGPEINSVDQYRLRYAQYRTDPNLKGMHAACPWFVTWDDHEVDNNYANDVSEQPNVNAEQLLARRANAYQVYYEMMPLRTSSLPKGPHMELYRRGKHGRLAEFFVLDTRQYRTDQPNRDGKDPLNEAALNPRNTMLGKVQREWLYQSLLGSNGTWNILAQQVMMAMVSRSNKDGLDLYSMDQWPGYANERMELLKFLDEKKIANPVVLTGDIHSNWVNDVRVDDRQIESKVVATEFVTTSLSSGGNGVAKSKGIDAVSSANGCVKWHNRERGYILFDVTPDKIVSDYKVVTDVIKPGGKTFSRAKFTVLAGKPGVV